MSHDSISVSFFSMTYKLQDSISSTDTRYLLFILLVLVVFDKQRLSNDSHDTGVSLPRICIITTTGPATNYHSGRMRALIDISHCFVNTGVHPLPDFSQHYICGIKSQDLI